MSESKQAQVTKDAFSIYQQSVDKMFSGIKQFIPQYHQSITNVQQEYMQAFESMVNSSITLQKEFAKKSGFTTQVPEATIKAIRETTDDFIKAASIQNQLALTTVDAAQQNIRTFNENTKSFVDLNKNIMQSWLSTFATK